MNRAARRSRRPVGALLALGLVVAVPVLAGVGFSGAAFNDSTDNPSNSVSSAANFTAGLKTGTYTGNGADQREVVTGLPFRPDWILIKATTAQSAVMRTRTMAGDQTKPLNGTAAIAGNRIEAINAAGFTVGTDASVNQNNTTYQWVAAASGQGAGTTGSYVGDGRSARSITLASGFSPEAVIVMPAAANSTAVRIEGMSAAFRLDSNTAMTDSVTSLGTRSFEVGSNATTNSEGVTYHYVAFSEVAGGVDVGTYTGNNMNNRQVTGLGFQPSFTLIRSTSSTTSRAAMFRTASHAANASSVPTATANATNGILSFANGSFSLGPNANGNATNEVYAYLALVGT